MTKAIPVLDGRASKSALYALRAPAEPPMPTMKLGCNCPHDSGQISGFHRCFYLLIDVCLTVMLLPTVSFCLGPAVASASIGTKLIPSSLKINLWTSLEWPMPRDLTM